MPDKLTSYVRRGSKKVRGWLTPIAADVLVGLANLQRQLGIGGPVCEIGVHHGKLFIILHLLTNDSEASVAWDLFERQNENVDGSGHGDSAIFRDNLKRHGCDLGRIRIHTENSLRLTADRIVGDCGGKVRLFSIDGGHTAQITRNDLSLAARALCNGGIIIVDDFFNEAWPGVAEGICGYFQSNDAGLVPVAIAGNKFFLTNDRTFATAYIDRINKPTKGYVRKKSMVFGNEVLIFIPEQRSIRRFVANTRIWKALRDRLSR